MHHFIISEFHFGELLVDFSKLVIGYGGFRLLQWIAINQKKRYHEVFQTNLRRVLYWLFLVPVTTTFFLSIFALIFHLDGAVHFVVAGTVFAWIYLCFKIHI